MILEEETKPLYLGPIMPTKILSDDCYGVDPNPDFIHENFQIKMGLVENSDFMIIDEELWNYLFEKYGGIPLERYTYRKTPGDMNVSVEVWLQKVEKLNHFS